MKRLVVFLLVFCPAIASPAADFRFFDANAPYLFNVSEVSKDGHVLHNRLSFNCEPVAPKTIECVVVQQDLTDPTPLPKEEQEKAIAKVIAGMGDLLTVCKEDIGQPQAGEPRTDTEYRAKLKSACQAKDRIAVAGAIRYMADIEGQTCKLTTVVTRHTFSEIKKDTWISKDPPGGCDNITLTGTLRRDPRGHSFWNYTETVEAKPSAIAPTVCHAVSETTQFTWRKAVTAYDLKCRYVAM